MFTKHSLTNAVYLLNSPLLPASVYHAVAEDPRRIPAGYKEVNSVILEYKMPIHSATADTKSIFNPQSDCH